MREVNERRGSPRKIRKYGRLCSVDVIYLQLRRGLWVGIARKARWLAFSKMQLDVLGHPGIFGIMHFDILCLETY